MLIADIVCCVLNSFYRESFCMCTWLDENTHLHRTLLHALT